MIPKHGMEGPAMPSDAQSLVAMYDLTEHEVKALKLIALGATRKQVGTEFGISELRVEARITKIGQKIGVYNNHQLIVAFGNWLLTGERPSIDAYGSLWICPKPPQGCGAARAIERFPGLPVDQRCEDCIHEHTKSRLSATKSIRLRNLVRLMVEKAGTKAAPDLPNINAMLSEFMDKDGGFHNFVKQWQYQLQVAREKKPGDKFVLDAHRDMMRLVISAMQAQAQVKPLADLTDQEGREYLTQLLIEQMAKKGVDSLLQVYTEDDESDEEQPLASVG